MANQQHLDMLLSQGLAVWNRWREDEPRVQPDLSGADLNGADLGGADLNGADLNGADLNGADLGGADLNGADLNGADLGGADLRAAHLFQANLRETNLIEAILVEADLFKANLFKANLREANLRKANLGGADLSRADLSRANLSEANLSEANLSGANLNWANLRTADLSKADLSRANLRALVLCEANLRKANLREADLYKANLREADLYKANFSGADLSKAYLAGASCVRTDFSHALLAGCTVYGIAAWDVNLAGTHQADLRITPDDSGITVDNLEVAQFLYLLLNNQRARELLDTITSKVVLILGRFSDDRKPILDALREALRHHTNGYIPVLFDFKPQQNKPILETVKTLANLARFVIADLTDPHMVRAELTAIIPNVPTVPIQPLIEANADLPTEFDSWALYRSVLPVYRYLDPSHLLANLTESVIKPVEAHVQARRL